LNTFLYDLPSTSLRETEVLQGDYSFEILQDYAVPWPRWLTLGCKCTRTL